MIATFALALALVLGTTADAQVEPPVPEPRVGIDQRLNEKIPLDLVFMDEQGNAVMLREYFGQKPVILVLAYYRCPRLCSLVLNGLVLGLARIDYQIGADFNIVTVSIDPREGPELAAAKKAAYVEQYGLEAAGGGRIANPSNIGAGWHFLTGEKQAIKRLAEAVGYRYFYDSQREEFAHASGIMMLTPDGTLARYFYGIEFSPRELQFGLEDCSAGKIGSPISRPLRLLCFAYDPATGTYTFLTMQLIRAGAVLTVLVITVFLVRAWRRERRVLEG
jgi:protein SCO1